MQLIYEKVRFAAVGKNGRVDLTTLRYKRCDAVAAAIKDTNMTWKEMRKKWGWRIVKVEIGVVEFGKGVISIKQ